jgi:hypothetical protein
LPLSNIYDFVAKEYNPRDLSTHVLSLKALRREFRETKDMNSILDLASKMYQKAPNNVVYWKFLLDWTMGRKNSVLTGSILDLMSSNSGAQGSGMSNWSKYNGGNQLLEIDNLILFINDCGEVNCITAVLLEQSIDSLIDVEHVVRGFDALLCSNVSSESLSGYLSVFFLFVNSKHAPVVKKKLRQIIERMFQLTSLVASTDHLLAILKIVSRVVEKVIPHLRKSLSK